MSCEYCNIDNFKLNEELHQRYPMLPLEWHGPYWFDGNGSEGCLTLQGDFDSDERHWEIAVFDVADPDFRERNVSVDFCPKCGRELPNV